MNEYKTPALQKRNLKIAIQKVLKGKTPAQDRVLLSKSLPTEYETLPVVLIYSTGESSELFDVSPKRYRRILTIVVECVATGVDDDDLDKNLEEIGDLVETWMELDETFGGIANRLELAGADYQTESGGASPIGLLSLRFEIEFFTYANRPEINCLDAFKTYGTDWKIGHDQGPSDAVIDAEDTSELDQ